MTEEVSNRPKWLDDEFLKTCIRHSQNFNTDKIVMIKDLALSYGVAKGENHMSAIYRARLKYQLPENEQVFEESFMVKVDHDPKEKDEDPHGLFEKEINIYGNVLPNLEKILEHSQIETRFNCRFIHRIKNKVLVLEDLKPQGFVVANRQKGFDLEDSKVIYNKLATFHAAGMCFFYSETETVKSKYARPLSYADEIDDIEGKLNMQAKRVKFNIEELKEYGDKYNKAIDFLTKYIGLLKKSKRLADLECIPGNKFNTIIHGDFWVNNIMLKYKEDGSIKDIIFVDYQVSCSNTIALDFIFFFLTSTSLEVRRNHYKELKNYYFCAVVENLKTLDYKGDIPTLPEFNEELKRCTTVALFCLNIMLPLNLITFDKKYTTRDESKPFSLNEVTQILEQKSTDRNYLDKMVASISILQDEGFMAKYLEQI